ncbi:MAG TPA: hypothetical protein VF580_07845 [Thermoanaerobaculia bacterium]
MASAPANCHLRHQVTTLDRAKLLERVGALGPQALEAVERGLRAAMDRH